MTTADIVVAVLTGVAVVLPPVAVLVSLFRIGERIQGARYRRQHGAKSYSPAAMAVIRQKCGDLDETLSAMQAELGTHWLDRDAAKVRGWNLDYVRGVKTVHR